MYNQSYSEKDFFCLRAAKREVVIMLKLNIEITSAKKWDEIK